MTEPVSTRQTSTDRMGPARSGVTAEDPSLRPDQARRTAFGQHGLTLLDRIGSDMSLKPISRVVRGYHRASVLDLGCGYDARLLCRLAPLIERGVGVDLSVSERAKAQQGLVFREASIDAALRDLEGESFDIVMLISVLEHLWDPGGVIGSCRCLLKSGGTLLINVPTWFGKRFHECMAFTLKFSTALEIDDHKMYYSQRDLWPLLVKAGFTPSRISMRYYKCGLNLFAEARNGSRSDSDH